jgi:lysophospholipase L1-like esterase
MTMRERMERQQRQRLMIAGIALAVVAVIVVAVILLMSRSPSGNAADTAREPEPTPNVYIALGDSVSSGYGLHGYAITAPKDRHSSLLYEMLKEDDLVAEYRNMAVSGFTTTDLLGLLNGMSEEEIALFNRARLITVNIGGNNILTPFLEYISSLEFISGVDSIRDGAGTMVSGAWGVIYEIVSGVSRSNDERVTVGGIFSNLWNVVRGAARILIGGVEVILGTPEAASMLWGSLSDELDVALVEGVDVFKAEYSEILDWISVHAPEATVIVHTVYNPIPQDILGISMAISRWADQLISSMNEAISEESAARDLILIDMYTYFARQPELVQFNLNPNAGDMSMDIVHPSEAGHKLIADLHYEYYKKYLEVKID